MQINCTYPVLKPEKLHREAFISWMKVILFTGAVVSLCVNLAVGGKYWSVVVIWSIWMVWVQLLSPDLVGYNRISQFIKLIINTCILLILINFLLSPAWFVGSVSIICFSALIIVGLLFFTDLERQKENMLPILFLIFLSLAGSIIGLSVYHGSARWTLSVMLGVSICLFVACFVILGGEFIRQCQKIFSIK